MTNEIIWPDTATIVFLNTYYKTAKIVVSISKSN
uniref:Uncharacterized protein n=1 Tax=Arundo donax TaxID=35708 RepID=A0A0A8Y0F7_ARUDO